MVSSSSFAPHKYEGSVSMSTESVWKITAQVSECFFAPLDVVEHAHENDSLGKVSSGVYKLPCSSRDLGMLLDFVQHRNGGVSQFDVTDEFDDLDNVSVDVELVIEPHVVQKFCPLQPSKSTTRHTVLLDLCTKAVSESTWTILLNIFKYTLQQASVGSNLRPPSLYPKMIDH